MVAKQFLASLMIVIQSTNLDYLCGDGVPSIVEQKYHFTSYESVICKGFPLHCDENSDIDTHLESDITRELTLCYQAGTSGH
jgi:hypothetical protein